jgi:acetyl esterase/lipase
MVWFLLIFFLVAATTLLYLSSFYFRPTQNLIAWYLTLIVFSYPLQIILLTTLGWLGLLFVVDFDHQLQMSLLVLNSIVGGVLISISLKPILWHIHGFDFTEFHIQGIFPVSNFKPFKPSLFGLLKLNRTSWQDKKTLNFSTRDGQLLPFDLWKSKDPKAPLVIHLFGGGYTIGSKDQLPHFMRRIVDLGYSVACPTYRLMPKHVWPTPAQDFEDFWKQLPQALKEAGLDPEYFVISGRSAGSHLAGHFIGKTKDPKIKGYINLYGPLHWEDLLRYSYDGDILDSKKSMSYFFGRDVHSNPEFLRSISPYHDVDSRFPKTLNIHGKCDPIVPWDQTHHFSKKLSEHGVPHGTYYLPYATHTFDYSLRSPTGARAGYLIEHFLKHLQDTHQRPKQKES